VVQTTLLLRSRHKPTILTAECN